MSVCLVVSTTAEKLSGQMASIDRDWQKETLPRFRTSVRSPNCFRMFAKSSEKLRRCENLVVNFIELKERKIFHLSSGWRLHGLQNIEDPTDVAIFHL